MRLHNRWIAMVAVTGLFLSGLPAVAADGKEVVNINTADTQQLMLLPRVGPSVAQRIIEHRETNGRFKTPQDLMLVRGIGEKTFQLIEPHVVVSGETTLTEKVKSSQSASPDP